MSPVSVSVAATGPPTSTPAALFSATSRVELSKRKLGSALTGSSWVMPTTMASPSDQPRAAVRDHRCPELPVGVE